jgi:hypothetical protein
MIDKPVKWPYNGPCCGKFCGYEKYDSLLRGRADENLGQQHDQHPGEHRV